MFAADPRRSDEFNRGADLVEGLFDNSTSKMPDADSTANVVYLKERGAAGSPAPVPLASSDPRMQAGEAIFTDTCTACHMRSGAGVEHMFPKLAGNVVATQDDPASLIRLVIAGGRAAATDGRPTSPAMPPRSAIALMTTRWPRSSPTSATAGATRPRPFRPIPSRRCAASSLVLRNSSTGLGWEGYATLYCVV
jgi:mono/diheme cytochrome c family protein